VWKSDRKGFTQMRIPPFTPFFLNQLKIFFRFIVIFTPHQTHKNQENLFQKTFYAETNRLVFINGFQKSLQKNSASQSKKKIYYSLPFP
jgi:hypothetical protein